MTIRGFRSPRAVVRELIFGPEPVGLAGATVLQRYGRAQLSGGPGGGLPHYGLSGGAETTFLGWVASPQEFIGAAQMGANKGVSVQETPALPADQAPAAMVPWLEDWTELEGFTP